jgi:hypothetical protein
MELDLNYPSSPDSQDDHTETKKIKVTHIADHHVPSLSLTVAPPVAVSDALVLTDSLDTNLPYTVMQQPVQGPINPFAQTKGVRNIMSGRVETFHMNEVLIFDVRFYYLTKVSLI